MTQTVTAEKLRSALPQTTALEDRLRSVIWCRKQLCAVTYGIELRDVSVMLESDWDRAAASIDRTMGTGHPLIDEFFAVHFSPMSTAWIHHHPELERVGKAFDRYQLIMRTHFDFERPDYRDKRKRKT